METSRCSSRRRERRSSSSWALSPDRGCEGAFTISSGPVTARVGRSLNLDLELDIHRPPQSVRAWWTDLPDEYVAKDPREQPHRIRVLARNGHRIELEGTWRGPLGRDALLRETLHVRDDGSWTFDARPWDSVSTTSSRHFPAVTGLGCTFEASSIRTGLWEKSSGGSWGDACCACWRRGGERPPRFASGMRRHPRAGARVNQRWRGATNVRLPKHVRSLKR